MADTRTYKVGTNRGKPRIWLDGKPLADNGFVGGTIYTAFVRDDGRIICLLDDVRAAAGPIVIHARLRKVTGRPTGKPLIDMNGRDVEIAFPGAKTVRVTFSPGRILIERGE
jgi:DNA (cytosine-5)-methyltransferase 1